MRHRFIYLEVYMKLIDEIRIPFKNPRLREVEKDYLERAKRRFFLHPRIPLSWVLKLNEAGVAGLRVGYVLIYCFVLKGSNCIKLSNYLLNDFRISKNQKSRGLRELEELGLIEMKINRGRQTQIKLLKVND